MNTAALRRYYPSTRSFRPLNRRELLYILQGFRCFYCRAAVALAVFTVDHVIPKSKGGDDSNKNTVGACMRCNQSKAATRVPNSLVRLQRRMYFTEAGYEAVVVDTVSRSGGDPVCKSSDGGIDARESGDGTRVVEGR